jgi:hypothetical protein
MSVYRLNMHESPASRIFAKFRRWPRVPSAELYRLRTALTKCVERAGSDSADELLTLVTHELERRTAGTTPLPQQNPRAIGLCIRERPVMARTTHKDVPFPRPPESRGAAPQASK